LQALLALEDGLVLRGRSFTGPGEALGEVVFNTSMTGYQEILTDPSYKGQIVTMTYPMMGNYGVNVEDIESSGIQVEGFIVKEYHRRPSNWRAQGDLADYLRAAGKLGVTALTPGPSPNVCGRWGPCGASSRRWTSTPNAWCAGSKKKFPT